jgi:hypothetical protein
MLSNWVGKGKLILRVESQSHQANGTIAREVSLLWEDKISLRLDLFCIFVPLGLRLYVLIQSLKDIVILPQASLA